MKRRRFLDMDFARIYTAACFRVHQGGIARLMRLISTRTYAPPLALAFLILSVSMIQPSAPEAQELSIWTYPSGGFVDLKGPTSLRGVTPVPLPQRLNGRYRVHVTLPGYEDRVGAIELRSRDDRLTLLPDISSLRVERFFKSLLVPGSGQVSGHRKTPGLIWGAASIGYAATSLVLDRRYQDRHDLYQEATGVLEEAALSGEVSNDDLALLVDTVFALEIESNAARRDRNLGLYVTSGLWAANLIDAVFFHSGLDLNRGNDNVILVGMNRKTPLRRALRSALFPGMGQAYTGRNVRAVLYAGAAIATGSAALRAHSDFQEEADRADVLNRERSELQNASLLTAELAADIDRRVVRAADQRSEVYDRRNSWAIAAGAIWAASILDAVFLSEPSGTTPADAGPELGFLTTPTGTNGVGVRLAF